MEDLDTRAGLIKAWNKDPSGQKDRLFFKVLLDIRDELKQLNKDPIENDANELPKIIGWGE